MTGLTETIVQFSSRGCRIDTAAFITGSIVQYRGMIVSGDN